MPLNIGVYVRICMPLSIGLYVKDLYATSDWTLDGGLVRH